MFNQENQSLATQPALRVLNNMEEAEEWMSENSGDYIEVRKGEDKKCKDYCSVCEFCNYYREKVE